METDRNNEPNETPAPPKLVAALRRTQAPTVFVPRTMDDAILRAAQKHLTQPPRSQNKFPLWLRWAIPVVLCVVVIVFGTYEPSGSKRFRHFSREDINRDGQVDILDAFQLARDIKAGKQMPPAADANGDGVIDERDAAVIAAQAVKLEKGGRS